ncbi:MAG: single-stranded DNA-binding protein [Clostridia bacterium]
MALRENYLFLAGALSSMPTFSHACFGLQFVRFNLQVERRSGAVDTLPVICEERLLPPMFELGDPLTVEGQLRAYSQRTENATKLMIAAFAQEVHLCTQEPENIVELRGALMRPPVFRSTPLGREIADLFLVVQRSFGKTDYLPVIAWGRNARLCGMWQPGDLVEVSGRLQSRSYHKLQMDGSVREMTAFEVSATIIESNNNSKP